MARKRFLKVFKALAPKSPTYVKNTRTSRSLLGLPVGVGTGVDEDPDQKAEAETAEVGTEWEICRKVSKAIITQDGMYEYPEDWDGTASSPTWPGGLPDPGESWFEIERVHEIVYINELTKEITREKFYVPEALGAPAAGFEAELYVIVTQPEPHVPVDSRIPNDLVTSSEATSAVAQAQSEV